MVLGNKTDLMGSKEVKQEDVDKWVFDTAL